MRTARMGSLNATLVGEGNGPVVVFLHGFGAPGDDLVPLAETLATALDGVRFVCPEAPLQLGREYGHGRAWWMIDLQRMERAIMAGEPHDLSREGPPGLAPARDALLGLLEEVDATLRPTSLVLGGFSQGAMLSLDVALRTDRRLAGLALLSGTLVGEAEWKPLLPARAGLEVFQSHGTDDALLPYPVAERLRDLMLEAGLAVEFLPFPGGHGIPMGVLRKLAEFLMRATRA